MTALLLSLTGLALLDSLNVLNIGVVAVVIYGSRLNRQSALPGGVSFIVGLLTVTTIFGLFTVLGLGLLTDVTNFHLTPTVRYWGEIAFGLALFVLAFLPLASNSAAPGWALAAMRERPWLLGFVGAAIGLGQAPTRVPYLAGLAMISAFKPLPPTWPILVIVFSALTVLPCVLLLGLSTNGSKQADRAQRAMVRILTQYGPIGVRIFFLAAGVVMVADALAHASTWW